MLPLRSPSLCAHALFQKRVRCDGELAEFDVGMDAQAPSRRSAVAFSVNGVWQGVAFEEIPQGIYFPAASLFTEPRQFEPATITFNFGPTFEFSPPALDGFATPKPMSARGLSTEETLVPMEEE